MPLYTVLKFKRRIDGIFYDPTMPEVKVCNIRGIAGRKAAATNKERYGEDFYKKIGKIGGEISTGGGFAANPELASIAGRIGGTKSRKNRRI